MSEAYDKYLHSEQWQKLQRRALARARYQCERCGTRLKLHVHHTFYPSDLRYDSVANLSVMCIGCHEATHGMSAFPQIRSGYDHSEPIGKIIPRVMARIEAMVKGTHDERG